MQYKLSETIEEDGPTAFARRTLSSHSGIFAERSALVFTPTRNLPPDTVGSGPLDVFIPVCTPDFYDCLFIRSYMSPRLWLDLLQRHTGFVRWSPFLHATVSITRVDTTMLRDDHLIAGTKALLDALKVQANGRRDGSRLYYFGAILDDARRFVTVSYNQSVASRADRTGMHIKVSLTSNAPTA